jgi:hypothetical protein
VGQRLNEMLQGVRPLLTNYRLEYDPSRTVWGAPRFGVKPITSASRGEYSCSRRTDDGERV